MRQKTVNLSSPKRKGKERTKMRNKVSLCALVALFCLCLCICVGSAFSSFKQAVEGADTSGVSRICAMSAGFLAKYRNMSGWKISAVESNMRSSATMRRNIVNSLMSAIIPSPMKMLTLYSAPSPCGRRWICGMST